MGLCRGIEWLGNRNAGFILTFIVILNLAMGSLVMNLHPDLYPPFFPFDLNVFFEPVRAEHGWLYALLVTFGLFAVNLTAGVIESIVRLRQSRTGVMKQIAALLIHGAILVTLAAHLHDGFYGSSEQAVLTEFGTEISDIGVVRVTSLHNYRYPDGSLKESEVMLEIERPDGTREARRMAYNEPALFDWGEREIIVQGGDHQPMGVQLRAESDGTLRRLLLETPLITGKGHLTLLGVVMTPANIPFARIRWHPRSGSSRIMMIALERDFPRHNRIKIGDKTLRFDGIIETPVVGVMVRYNPAIPLIVLGLLLSVGGLVLLIKVAGGAKSGSADRSSADEWIDPSGEAGR